MLDSCWVIQHLSVFVVEVRVGSLSPRSRLTGVEDLSPSVGSTQTFFGLTVSKKALRLTTILIAVWLWWGVLRKILRAEFFVINFFLLFLLTIYFVCSRTGDSPFLTFIKLRSLFKGWEVNLDAIHVTILTVLIYLLFTMRAFGNRKLSWAVDLGCNFLSLLYQKAEIRQEWWRTTHSNSV